MCRVMIMGGIKKENVKNAWRFVRVMGPLMSKGNNDGIGYTAVDSNGDMFGERWWYNTQFMKKASVIKEEPDSLKQISEFLSDTNTYGYGSYNYADYTNSFGNMNAENMVAITLHTRMATSGKEFKNTHPFVYPEADTSLIHNGIIHNVKDFDLKVSTCDSEAILISYLKNEVNLDHQNILKVANELNGYFMCGVFSRDGNGRRILDLFKHSANLYASYVRELDTVVFSTNDDDITSACQELGFTFTKPKTVKNDILMRMDTITGKIEQKFAWEYPSQKKSSTQTPMNTQNTDMVAGSNSKVGWMQKVLNNKTPSMSPEMFKYFNLTTEVEHYGKEQQILLMAKYIQQGAKNA